MPTAQLEILEMYNIYCHITHKSQNLPFIPTFFQCENAEPFLSFCRHDTSCNKIGWEVLKDIFHNKLQKYEGEEVDAKLGMVVDSTIKAKFDLWSQIDEQK